MEGRDGQAIGTAIVFSGLPSELASSARTSSAARQSSAPAQGITVAIEVMRLPAGTHGFHVHSVGQCQTPDFASVGPHLNPDGRSHGVKNPNGPHAGDLPNLTVDTDGTAAGAFFVGHLSMPQIQSSPHGASLVIDANPDDNVSDPDGGSGAHIACGVIRPGTPPPPSPTPTPSATPPATRTVSFSGLPMGSFAVHLHSVCNGSQNFHITVLGTLVVNSDGQGTISVPSGYFDRGLCVIVYGNAALSTVIATKTI
jgi:superoxide dismutase, Cu-Zn family